MQLLVLETLAAKRPSVMLLQDLRTSVGRRARIIKEVESAAPHYKVFIDGSRAGPTGYPFTLMTIVTAPSTHRTLRPVLVPLTVRPGLCPLVVPNFWFYLRLLANDRRSTS